MYLHEKEIGKNKYFIMAVIFHIAIISAIFFVKKPFSDDVEFTAPPESSTSEATELSEENTIIDEELLENTPEKEVEEIDKKFNANAVSSQEVNKAIENFNDNIKRQEEKKVAEQKRLENEKIEAIKQEKLKKEESALLERQKAEQQKIEKQKVEKQINDKKNLEKLKQQKELEAKKNKALKEKELQEKKRKENLEKSIKAEQERKKKSADAIKKATLEKQKANRAAQAKRNSINNRGYNSTQKSLSNSEKLALLKIYRDQVYNKVYSNWLRPSYSKRGWECKVHVTQSNRGEVKNVKIVSCHGDKIFQDSVKKAIYKSSPLPLPKDKSLFNSTIEIKFKVT